MKLIYDARPIANPHTGLGRYTGSLLLALLGTYTNRDLRVHVLLPGEDGLRGNGFFQALQPFLQAGCCQAQFVALDAVTLTQQLRLPGLVNRLDADLYFYPHFDLPLAVSIPSIFVVHDLLPILVARYVQRFAPAKKAYFTLMLRLAIRRAGRCIAVSECTRRDLLALVGARYADKIDVVGEGPVLAQEAPGREPTAPGLGLPAKFLLYVGDRRPHKNLRRVLEIFFLLKELHGYSGSLVLAGSSRNYDFDLDSLIAARSDVVVAGNVADSVLSSLYASADALLLLSAYEGFGLPVVEAATHGTRIVVSDGGSLAEIAPPGALVVARTKSVDLAAKEIAVHLARPPGETPSDYLLKYSWNAAARQIFRGAYSA